MPQHSMFPGDRRIEGMSLILTDEIGELGSGMTVIVKTHYSDLGPTTTYAKRWSGLMPDLLTTLAEDAAAAFLYGEPGGILRACVSCEKVARAHDRRHNRIGS